MEPVLEASVRNLVGEILFRYGSIDVFCLYLRGLLDAPTCELPLVGAVATGRHRWRGAEPVDQ
ncbi:hypothetical protein ACFVUS_27560 [Nocardia sp. NPDC058058]|uniref:hypothetical protein n=1 Tax=Nocardia sp. NPDC058058 TaxID=3346317 RepID=UPI0036D8E977